MNAKLNVLSQCHQTCKWYTVEETEIKTALELSSLNIQNNCHKRLSSVDSNTLKRNNLLLTQLARKALLRHNLVQKALRQQQ